MKTTSTTLAVLALAASLLPTLRAMADPMLIGEPGTTVRVSVGPNGEQRLVHSAASSISPDGRYVSFSNSDNAGSLLGVYIHDRLTGMVAAVYDTTITWTPRFSGDGRFLVFANGNFEIVLYDQQDGSMNVVSVNSSGEIADRSGFPSISANGRYIAFQSSADNLLPEGMFNGGNIFVRDRVSRSTEWISMNAVGTTGQNYGNYPSISADGSSVAFRSESADLVAGDTNRSWDVFVRDRDAGTTERVSVSSSGRQASRLSGIRPEPAIDATGRRIVFWSDAANLVDGDTNGEPDAFVHDRKTGETRRVSVDSNGAQRPGWSYPDSISANGRYIAFNSNGTFVHDLFTGVTTRESVAGGASFSADGRSLLFETFADNLVEGDTNGKIDVFVRTRHLLSYTGLAALADIDGNGAPELAALRVLADGNVEVTIKDGLTKALINTLTFPNSDRMVRGLAVLPDISGDGSPEVAVLFRRHDGLGSVRLRDAVSGAEIPAPHFFGKDWESRAITSLDANRDGVPDIAVLALKDDMSEARVQIRDAVNQVVVGSVRLPAAPGDAYAGLTALPDMNGNGTPEIAALRTLPGDRQEVIINDSQTGESVQTVHFNVTDMQAGGIAAVGTGAVPAVAVLYRRGDGQGKVQVRNAMTGEWVRTLTFVRPEWEAAAIASLDANSDGVMDVGILAVKDNGSGVAVQVRDIASKKQLGWVGFPADDR